MSDIKTVENEVSTHSPLVSIIVPTWNLEAYIGDSINSLLSQSYINIEILVIDDHSTDKTPFIIKSIVARDKRLKLFSNRFRKGASGARNTGIELANGDWIAFLDGDDLLHPHSIRNRMESALRNSNVRFLSGDFYRFHYSAEDAYSLQSATDPDWRELLSNERNEFGEVHIQEPLGPFLQKHLTCTASVFLRRDLLKEVGKFDELLPRSEDVQFWLRAAACSCTFVFVSQSLSYYRQRPGSLSDTKLAPDQFMVEALTTLRRNHQFQSHLKLLDQSIRNHAHKITYHYRKQRMVGRAITAACHGLKVDPFGWFAWKNLIGSILRI